MIGNDETLAELRGSSDRMKIGGLVTRNDGRVATIITIPGERLVANGQVRTFEVVVLWADGAGCSPEVERLTLWNSNEATGRRYGGEPLGDRQ